MIGTAETLDAINGTGACDLAKHGRDRIDQNCDLFADGVPATGPGGGMDRL